MTDCELLELAAKAAGFQNYTMRGDTVFVETGAARGDSGYYWNPLTDDGDALRLAVMLGLYDLDALLFQFGNDPLIDTGTDPYAATRRAIVRAAAEIGRNMT